MNKPIRLILISFTLSFGLLFAQDDCPNDVEFYAPGEGEPGCIDYTDCNENGAFDYGEPCYDEPPEGETDPVADAYFMALDDGASPEDAFAAATDVVYELEVEHGEMTEEEYQDGLDHVSETFHEALEGGASPDEAFGAAMAAADDLDDEGEEGGNYGGDVHPIDQVFDMYGEHTWLNCEAVSFGAPSYWIGDMEYGAYPDPLCEQVFIDFYHAIDANDDGAIDFGEAAVVWGDDDESQEIFAENDLNGDGVVDEGEFMDATAPPEDMDMDDGGGDGDTYWADEAYQLEGDQGHYDRVMSVGEEDREYEYHMIMDELGMEMDHDEGDMGDMHPIDQVYDMYGEHTWRNCEAVSSGAPSYWIGEDEYASYPDPFCEQVFVDFYHAIDANDDGAIDYGEAAVVWGDSDESQEIFAENDLNGDGVVDEGEFMDATAPPDDMDHDDMDHDEGDMGSPIDEAYFEALDNGASPQDALAAAEAVAYQLEVEEGDVPEEQFNADGAAIAEAFDQLIGDDVDPHDAYFMALEIVFGGEEEHDDEEHHDGGWYCQICDIHFDTEEEMDDHAAEMGHIHEDEEHHDEGDDD